MSILFNDIVFGPIHSRRLGSSLGINLMPKFGKFCTFDCIYCECGWNKDGRNDSHIPTYEEVDSALRTKFVKLAEEGTIIDTITFSGNGEPTVHPDFPRIIDTTIELRNRYFPKAAISVLSNATQIGKESIREALKKITNPILKIDSALEEYVRIIDNPYSGYSLEKTLGYLKEFDGNFILQTMFLKGEINGRTIDCTSKELTEPWIKMVLDLRPREVMMYTIDREPPASSLEKVTVEEMQSIASELVRNGIKVQIRG